MLCSDYLSIIADCASVSIFLCTLNTWAWRIKCSYSQSTQIFDETEVLLQDSNLQPLLMISLCLTLNNLSCLLVKDSCFIMFLCYVQQLLVLVGVVHLFRISMLHCSLSTQFCAPCPLIDWVSVIMQLSWCTEHVYIYIYIYCNIYSMLIGPICSI